MAMTDEDMPVLPIDLEVEEAMQDPEAFARLMQERSDRVTWGMARRLTSLVAIRRRYHAQLEDIQRETLAALEPVETQIAALQDALESIAKDERERSGGKVKRIHVPGLGDIATRENTGRPRVADEDALRPFLRGQEREVYLKPQPDKVDARAVLTDLAEIARNHGIEPEDGRYEVPGIEYGETTISATIEWLK